MSKKHKHAPASAAAATSIDVIDDYGTRRTLTKAADCDCFEGVLETADGPLPYTLPRSVVETWKRVRP